MSAIVSKILQHLHVRTCRHLAGPATIQHYKNQLRRNIQVGAAGTESVTEQNRRRALEYLDQYSKEEIVPSSTDIRDDEELDIRATTRIKPTAKEAAKARVQKHIPVVTGRVPSSDQLVKLLERGHGAHNLVAIDISKKASFADWLLLCCGRTSNHVLAIADGIVQDLRALEVLVGGKKVTISGSRSSDWIVVDIGNVVVHVMTDDARDHYRLEELWLSERASDNYDSESFP